MQVRPLPSDLGALGWSQLPAASSAPVPPTADPQQVGSANTARPRPCTLLPRP